MTSSFPATWRVESLGALLNAPADLTYGIVQPGASVAGGVPIVRVRDVRGGRVLVDEAMHVDPVIEARYSRSRLSGGELLVTLVGTAGEVAVAPASLKGWNTARAVGVARIRPDVGAHWVALCLRSRESQERIASRVNTTVQTTLNLKDLREIPIPVPPEGELRAIAATLHALDDKIDSNRRLSELVPRLIRTRVDEVLAGASVSTPVAELARFVNGGAYTKGATGRGRMVIRIAELNGDPGASTVYTELEVPNDKVARPGDLLMSWSGSLDVYCWSREEAIINQHIFKVIPDRLPAWLVFDRLKRVMPIFQAIARDKATTMGHIQRGHLESTTVETPPESAVARLDSALGLLWRRLLVAEREALTLASLRDALLPELLSGRIRVPEAREAAVVG